MSKTVLTVDDSPTIRQMVRMTLAGAGYQVAEAANGSEGLAKAQAAPPSMVITDLNMPVMDGLTFIRELRKLPVGRGLPIIFLTTESDADVKRQAKEAGATGWIVKPFQQEQLLAVVKKVLG
ncbi:response regulator [Azospirillum sp. A39]|uniref:response regulator n=1 Tax=Azospirillum sp. A39 TaxID=3462279 RepID=UPI0040452FFA